MVQIDDCTVTQHHVMQGLSTRTKKKIMKQRKQISNIILSKSSVLIKIFSLYDRRLFTCHAITSLNVVQ